MRSNIRYSGLRTAVALSTASCSNNAAVADKDLPSKAWVFVTQLDVALVAHTGTHSDLVQILDQVNGGGDARTLWGDARTLWRDARTLWGDARTPLGWWA